MICYIDFDDEFIDEADCFLYIYLLFLCRAYVQDEWFSK